MSKKLIAVAAAAALALTGLVGVAPANATITVVFSTLAADGTTDTAFTPSATSSGASAQIAVPFNNKLEYTVTTARSSLAKVTVNSIVSGNVVTASSTGGLKIIDVDGFGSDFAAEDAADKDYTSASGTESLSKTATTTSLSFYVYTTKTSAGSLTVSVGGNSRVVYIKGLVGPAYRLSMTAPTSVGTVAPTSNNVFASVVDVFGNNVESGSGLTAAATSGATLTTLTWDADDKRYEAKVHNATAGPFAITASITDPTEVTALGAKVVTAFATVNAVDASAQVVLLTAQVAALQAQLENSRPTATSVTKKKYNTLARKWNAANPSARVALKK
jgi:hypothetical protein